MSSPQSEDITDELPTSINPYETLGLGKTATADEIKSAYRKLALRNHPDKVPDSEKETAHTKFQEIAFAYAILSDPVRRNRYDTTGRTEESVSNDDFNWSDFYRTQFKDVITTEAIAKIRAEYKASEEERKDLLEAYEQYEGDMTKIFETVMLSDVFEDEERFRRIIDRAIKDKEVKGYKAYTKESKTSRKRRAEAAKKEEEEAREAAREMGLEEQLFGGEDEEPITNGDGKAKGKKGQKKGGDQSALAALIAGRQKERAANFIDRLEEKYTNMEKAKKGKKRGAAAMDVHPPEEAFEKAVEKMRVQKVKKAPEKKVVEVEDAQEVEKEARPKRIRRTR